VPIKIIFIFEMFKNKFFINGMIIATMVAIADLLSKRVIFAILEEIAINNQTNYPEIEIFSFFSLVYVWNRGVSFGMFNQIENAQILLSILQFSIAIVICFWLFFNEKKNLVIPLGLIIGGALGNVVDRIRNGAVADFLDFHIWGYHWPAFNLADSCVFIGVVLIVIDDIFTKPKEK